MEGDLGTLGNPSIVKFRDNDVRGDDGNPNMDKLLLLFVFSFDPNDGTTGGTI